MGKISLLLVIGIMVLKPLKGDKPAYVIYNQKGREVSYQAMAKAAAKAEVILFGEKHNNPIAHWLQRSLAQSLASQYGDSLILGAEMFQTEDQQVLNEYLAGLIKPSHFTKSTNLWSNYETDYKPLVEMAKQQGLPFIATNVPRRYANYVAYHGLAALDTFSAGADSLMAPRPIPLDLSLKSYQRIQEMGAHGKAKHLAKAQALKDATMAFTIQEKWKPGHVFLHLNGSFHSNHFEGIYWYLEQYQPSLKQLTISTVEQADTASLKEKHEGKADFIIVTPKDMATSY